MSKRNVGTLNSNAKLNPDMVFVIRYLYRNGLFDQPRLAEMFGVAESTLSRVVAGIWWKHVPLTLIPAEGADECGKHDALLQQCIDVARLAPELLLEQGESRIGCPLPSVGLKDLVEKAFNPEMFRKQYFGTFEPTMNRSHLIRCFEQLRQRAVTSGDGPAIQALASDLAEMADKLHQTTCNKVPDYIEDDVRASMADILKAGKATIQAWAMNIPDYGWTMVDANGASIRIMGRTLDGYDKPAFIEEVCKTHGYDYQGVLVLDVYARGHDERGWCGVFKSGDIVALAGRPMQGLSGPAAVRRACKSGGFRYMGLWFESVRDA